MCVVARGMAWDQPQQTGETKHRVGVMGLGWLWINKTDGHAVALGSSSSSASFRREIQIQIHKKCNNMRSHG